MGSSMQWLCIVWGLVVYFCEYSAEIGFRAFRYRRCLFAKYPLWLVQLLKFAFVLYLHIIIMCEFFLFIYLIYDDTWNI